MQELNNLEAYIGTLTDSEKEQFKGIIEEARAREHRITKHCEEYWKENPVQRSVPKI